MKIVSHRRAMRIARKWHPTIHQEFKRLEDMIVPIHLGNFLVRSVEEPTLYYSVREDQKYQYILYCVFHREDWSELPWPIKGLDEHQFDFEGFLVVVDRKEQQKKFFISVFHHQLLRAEIGWTYPQLYIDAGGHGIRPSPEGEIFKGNIVKYRHCKLVNMMQDKQNKWIFGDLKKTFNKYGVSTPDQWAHHGKYKGWIYKKPDKLVKEFFGE